MTAFVTVQDEPQRPKPISVGSWPARVIAVIVIVGSVPWWHEVAVTLTVRR